MPEREIIARIIIHEDEIQSQDSEQPPDNAESESEGECDPEVCDCNRVITEYEDLFDPDLNPELPTNEKMDEMFLKYQKARDLCSQCPSFDEENEEGCSCERFEKIRANVLRSRNVYIIEYYSADYIPSTELEWYYRRDGCRGCKERRKKKVLCYRKWTKDGRTFLISDYLPNSYDRYPYSS